MKYLFLPLLATFCLTAEAQSWTPLSVGNTADVMDISFPSDDTGFVSLGNNTVRKTYDGGLTWSNVSLHAPNSGGGRLEFLSSSKGFMMDDSGIVMTTNGGSSWSFCLINLNIQWLNITFYDQNTGYASGVSPSSDTFFVYKTINGGSTWFPCTPVLDYSAYYPFVFFRTATEGYLTGSHDLYRTTDGGLTWVSVYSVSSADIITTVTAPDATNAYCATQYYMDVSKSTNGGLNWSSTSQTLASPPYESYFISGSTGFICGGDGVTSGYIVQTTNGGNSWTPVYSGGQTMLCMDFPSNYTGYCGGTGGVIMKYSDPMNVSESSRSMISSYPNPASDFLIVENVAAGSEITITNSLGQIVMSQIAIDNRMRIDVHMLDEGVYVIGIIGAEQRFSRTFIHY